MAGLLYKDFTAVRGKKLLLILFLLTIFYLVLRMLFPGTGKISAGLSLTDDTGNVTGNIIDMIFVSGEFILLWFLCNLINSTGTKIIQFDEKNKITGYLCSLPVSKRTYVASKYVFIGIFAYGTYSLYDIWHHICLCFAGDGSFTELSILIYNFSIPFLCLVLFVSSIELPLFLIIGKAKAMLVKIGILLLIGLLLFGYLLFGDLNRLARLDIENLVQWMMHHYYAVTLLSVFSPVITLGQFYFSYRMAVKFYDKKEDIHA